MATKAEILLDLKHAYKIHKDDTRAIKKLQSIIDGTKVLFEQQKKHDRNLQADNARLRARIAELEQENKSMRVALALDC